MNNKKHDLPAMPFYIGDWNKDPAIKVLSREDKMIWLEMIFLMWESHERGYLTFKGKPMTKEHLCNALNLDNQRLSTVLTYFYEIGLYSVREVDGAIFSRKIIHILELSNKRKIAGKQGGNPVLVNQRLTDLQAKGLPNAEIEYEVEILKKNILNKDKTSKPTLQEIVDYCKQINSKIDGEAFFHYYEQTDWVKANGQKIKNWKSTIRTWEKRTERDNNGFKPPQPL